MSTKSTVSKSTGYFESFDGTPIYYEVRGQGLPLIFAYGIACGSNHWRHQIRAFSQKYSCITFDYRGHHKSGIPKDRSHLSIDAIARDVAALCQHLKIDKSCFLGHSFGAQILLRTYELAPQLFHNMILVNGFATNPIQGMFGLDAVTQAFKAFKQGYEQMPETISYLWKFAVTNPIALRLTGWAGGFNLSLTSFKDIEIYARGVASIEMDVFLQLFEQMMTYDGRLVLDRIQAPTLIIGGDKDTVTALPYQRTLHNNIKGSELLIVPYGSHCTQLDMPDFVNLRIEKFLNQVDYPAEKPAAKSSSKVKKNSDRALE
ncbi:MAG: alpha/beta fold hydrolase [Bdellovibrionales bacterium]